MGDKIGTEVADIRLLQVFTNGYEWYAATSAKEATRLWEKHTGEDSADYGDLEWKAVELYKPLSVWYDPDLERGVVGISDGPPIPENAEQKLVVTARVGSWLKRFNETGYEGFIGSTEY